MNRRLVTGRTIRAVLDEPHAVPGQPGHDLGLRVEDPGVPEVGDEDAALDVGDRARRSAAAPAPRTRFAPRAPPARRPRRRGRCSRRRRPSRPAGVEEPRRDAVPNEIERPLRRSLDVERDADRARVGDVVAERDRAIELRLADAGERPAFLDGLAIEAEDQEERQDVRDAVGLEDDLVAARLEIGRVARRVAGLRAARAPTAAPSRSPRRTERCGRLPSAVGVRAMPSTIAAVPRPVSRWPALLANASGPSASSRSRPSRGPPAASTNARTRRPARRASRGRWPRPNGRRPGASARGARPGQSGSAGGRAAASRTPSIARPSDSSSAGPSTEVDAFRPSSATRMQDVVDLGGDVLVDEAGREAGQGRLSPGGRSPRPRRRAPARGRGRRCGPPARAQRCAVGRALGRRHRRHPRTPTRIPRKRAGTAGWPVWPICCGWPLPQFGVPQNVHSSRPPSMSSAPQNRGLIAV